MSHKHRLLPREVEVRMYLGEPGRSSVHSSYELVRDGRTFAEGTARIVWIDLATGRSAPLPDVIVAPLHGAFGHPGGRRTV